MTASPRWISLGLLGVCLLALLIGLLTALQGGLATQGGLNSDKNAHKGAQLLSPLKGPSLMAIDLSGPIIMSTEDNGLFSKGDSNAVTARKGLEEALEDDSVKGVLLAINSPGGTVGMSQELNRAVRRLAERKPVVAYMGDMAASGGYYAACGATKIMANPGTLTGSIGVILSTLNFKTLMQDKLGVRAYTIKSGRYKDLLNPYREMTDDERALIQALIDASYQQFLTAVIEGRTAALSDDAVKRARAASIRAVADGRVLIGAQAQKAGLVDALGDVSDAQALLTRLAQTRFHLPDSEKLPIKEYSRRGTLADWIGLKREGAAQGGDALGALSAALPLSLRYPGQPLWIAE
ncbi:MAG: signal peptide peptidase SppA [Vampirovibrionales bacterium]|nr:signal peptide peptidase SppA [Vampirovibrionales bacterium]